MRRPLTMVLLAVACAAAAGCASDGPESDPPAAARADAVHEAAAPADAEPWQARRLLQEARSREVMSGYVRTLLAAFGGDVESPGPWPH